MKDKNEMIKDIVDCNTEDGNALMSYKYNYTDSIRFVKEDDEIYEMEPNCLAKASEETESIEDRGRNYTVSDYSYENCLPEGWLKSNFYLTTMKDPDGTSYLKIPYCREDGSEVTFLKRYANRESKWKLGSGKNICLYGEWKLQSIYEVGSVVLVEGESETQVLWRMGIQALGVPSLPLSWKAVAKSLQGLQIYICRKPGPKGEKFQDKIVSGLRKGGFCDKVYSFSCSALDGIENPSGVFLKYGLEDGNKKIAETIDHAKPINLEWVDGIQEDINGFPISLRNPDDWEVSSDQGIYHIDPDTEEETRICKTPIIVTRRIKKIGASKEKIEVAFKRDGEWHKEIFVRSELFTARGIIALADYGCTVTSENAKEIVKFLSALEEENDEALEIAESVSTLGWQPGNRFIPGKADDLIMDLGQTGEKKLEEGYCQKGTMEGWIESMQPHRERDDFRFVMAASFAAPLLRILSQRNFFVYIWGNSQSGKTALLKAAISAWGDPENLMVTFNATGNGLEQLAAFYHDLPLGIDEKQTQGNNQEALEDFIYMIANGTGKVRAAKDGGIQEISSWKTIALTTGEEPISDDMSQNGVNTRTIELYTEGLFENDSIANQMHDISSANCGWAGPEFIRNVIAYGESNIKHKFNEMSDYLHTVSKRASGAHISEVAVVALADAMVDTWIFKAEGTDGLQIDPESWERAKQMGKAILERQVSEEPADTNEHAVQVIVDWIDKNRAHFSNNPDIYSPWLGWIDEEEDTANILSTSLTQALKEAGYSDSRIKAIKKYMAKQELIMVSKDKNKDTAKMDYTVSKYFKGDKKTRRVVVFDLGKYSKSLKNSDPEKDCRQESFTADDQGFIQINKADADKLPFD